MGGQVLPESTTEVRTTTAIRDVSTETGTRIIVIVVIDSILPHYCNVHYCNIIPNYGLYSIAYHLTFNIFIKFWADRTMYLLIVYWCVIFFFVCCHFLIFRTVKTLLFSTMSVVLWFLESNLILLSIKGSKM